MTITRRTALAAGAAMLAAPRLAPAQPARTLRFVPQGDLAILDPIWTQGFITRNHAMAVFDTLYGTDAEYRTQPQMAAGHVVDDDGLTWTITLRDGLRFHDGSPVLGRDCAASIRRWGARDTMGQLLMAATEEVSAPSDREVRFRLKRPFPLLPAALGKAGSNVCAIMPERLARTDPFNQVTEMVGSGPFRFLADERVSGARVTYARFEGYVPRPDGVASFTAGPKVARFDRIEWHTMPDSGTASAAMQRGEMDWWENPSYDLLPVLKRDKTLTVAVTDRLGGIGTMRLNHLQAPFDNPRLRRAVLGAISQADFMQAAVGDEKGYWNAGVGMFCPGTPMANDAGMGVLTGPRDMAGVRAAVKASGYAGERVVIPVASDYPVLNAFGLVAADAFGKAGLNVDAQAMDWGSILQRVAKTEPVSQGGWSAFTTYWSGLDLLDPAGNGQLRATGRTAARGWPTSPEIEALRAAWLQAGSDAERKAIAEKVQVQALHDVPYIPLGHMLIPTVHRSELQGVPAGYPLFWSVRRAA